MSLRLFFILILVLTISACGKKKSEEVDEAIDIAQDYLSENKCKQAIDLLEDVGRDFENPYYIQVLASAYACRAKFSEIDFLDTEIDKLDSTDMSTLFKSLTQLKWSGEHQADSAEFSDLKTAIDIVQGSSTGQPSQVKREDKFGTRNGGTLGVQALFMNLAQLGKFLHFYGNVSSAGVKGGGAASTDEQGATVSTCFAQYTAANAQLVITPAVAGACRYPGPATFVGHPDLDFASLTSTKTRMCEGLVMVTNIIDILEHITLTDPDYGDLTTLSTQVTAFRTTATTTYPALATLLNTTSQSTCETLVASASEWDNLQLIFALLFEVNLK